MSVWKQFTTQDFSITPFNAHKQYNYNSASAAVNSITHFSTRYTSESISIYSSASSHPDGVFDPINTIKYNQIDHLFYKNYKRDSSRLFGHFNYFYHRRELYDKANILSIPSGLYGHQIKPGSFYLKAPIGNQGDVDTEYEVVDDTYGNLIISGTDVNNYLTNINQNLFKLNPGKGFKKYHLGVYEGYAIDYGDVPNLNPVVNPDGSPVQGWMPRRYQGFWRKGELKPNFTPMYSNTESFHFDDSYYGNPVVYNKVNFKSSSLGKIGTHNFPMVNISCVTGSNIVAPHHDRYNFNRDDNFAISFYIEPQLTSTNHKGDVLGNFKAEVGQALGGGIIFNIDANAETAYVVYPEVIVTSKPYAMNNPNTSIGQNTGIGGGETNTLEMINFEDGTNFPLAKFINTTEIAGYTGWWIPNEDELTQIYQKLGVPTSENPTVRHLSGSIINLGPVEEIRRTDLGRKRHLSIETSQINSNLQSRKVYTPSAPFFTKDEEGSKYRFVNSDTDVNGNPSGYSYDHFGFPSEGSNCFPSFTVNKDLQSNYCAEQACKDQNLDGTEDNPTNCTDQTVNPLIPFKFYNPNFGNRIINPHYAFKGPGIGVNLTTGTNPAHDEYVDTLSMGVDENNTPIPARTFVLPVRKVNLGKSDGGVGSSTPTNLGMGDNAKRYILCKSTTQTAVAPPNQNTAGIGNTSDENNMQLQNIPEEGRFPYEIYMISSSIYFDRSDGDNIASINYEITETDKGIFKNTHIVCQNSASIMQIWVNGGVDDGGTLVPQASIDVGNTLTNELTANNANLYIGSKGIESSNDGLDSNTGVKFFNGNIGYINIFDTFLTSASITPMSESVDNSPYIGNLFYQNGFAVITHPNYTNILGGGVGFMAIGDDFIVGAGTINNLKFQGTHPMYEHEYQCHVDEHEFNKTYNITARKLQTQTSHEFANFTTSSLFNTYVTTIGLYNDQKELLVVGKLGQPVRLSDKTDTTFVMRFDT